MIEGVCQKRCVKFRVHFSQDNAPLLGRPIEVYSDQIETLTEDNQCYIMRETADTLKISKSIKLLVKMKNVFYFTKKTIQTLWLAQIHTKQSHLHVSQAP